MVYASGYASGALYKSTNGGADQSVANAGVTLGWGAGARPQTTTALALGLACRQVVYAGADEGVPRSTNQGGDWVEASKGLTWRRVDALAVDPSQPQRVCAATLGGVYVATFETDDTAVEVEPSAVPVAADLQSVHPNPGNGATTICYWLSAAGRVHLAAYDLTGQRVRLLTAEAQGPGVYQVVWDGRSDEGRAVASGVYLIRLDGGQVSQVGKVTLVR